jgi:hypothetical protein
MLGSALQLTGLAAICLAVWLWSTIAGIGAVGVSLFAVGFLLESQ